jgi:ribosomal protein S18 acetylase RimI-like enzyme
VDGFSIVRGSAEDVDRLEPLWLSMVRHHGGLAPAAAADIPFREESETWLRRRPRYEQWLEDPGARLFLAVDSDGEAVGYAVTRVGGEEATMATGRVGELESLAVLPDHRGRGVGEALVGAALEHFRELGLREWNLAVMDGNERARAFYERLGLRAYVTIMLGRIPDA